MLMRFWLILALTGLAVPAAMAADTVDSTAVEDDPAVLVDRLARSMLAMVERERDGYSERPTVLRERIAATLAPRVDYDRIVRGVIGQYRDAMDDAQIEQFRKVFEHSLVRLYTDALVSLGAETVTVGSSTVNGNRASVSMQVTTEQGEQFNLIYSLGDSGAGWQVRNIVVDGINLGLTYRNQFASLVTTHEGRFDEVVANWAQSMDE